MAKKDEGMRLTARRGRGHKGGKNYGARHNDRDFPTENTPHIAPEKTKDNIYWYYCQKKCPGLSFVEAEKKFYEDTFAKGLEAQNKRYGYHKEHHKNMDELREQRRTSPEEMIFQIGNRDVGQPSLIKINNAFVKFQNWHKKQYPQIKLLDYALHADEYSIHIQSRQVFIGHDRDGNAIPNQKRCLTEMGIPLPNPDKKEGRYNNSKMTYTKDCRDKMFEICREMGLALIEKPKEAGRSGLTLQEYKTRREQEKLEEMKQKSMKPIPNLDWQGNSIPTGKKASYKPPVILSNPMTRSSMGC